MQDDFKTNKLNYTNYFIKIKFNQCDICYLYYLSYKAHKFCFGS